MHGVLADPAQTFPLQIFLNRGDIGVGHRARGEIRLRLEQRAKQGRRAEHLVEGERIAERRVLAQRQQRVAEVAGDVALVVPSFC